MRQGSIRAPLRDRAHDLYETPPCAIRTLMRVERLPQDIWEPCAGRGAISRELLSAGHAVIAHDLVAYDGADCGILSGLDFLMEWRRPADTIVTNPPFKNADAFIRHGLALGCDVIVLLRLMALEGATRSDLIDGHLMRVWAGVERLPMMHREGWRGPKLAQGAMPFAWFIFTATKRLPGIPIQLHRVSWRDSP